MIMTRRSWTIAFLTAPKTLSELHEELVACLQRHYRTAKVEASLNELTFPYLAQMNDAKEKRRLN